MKREQITQALTLLAKTEPRKAVDALVWAFDDMMRQRDELLEALQDLTAQIAADENADCLHLLPQTKVFDAALTAIAKATGGGSVMFEDKDWKWIALIACVALLCGTAVGIAKERVEFERVRCEETKP